MTQVLLIKQSDFIPYRDINKNIVTEKMLDPYIYQSQFIDFKEVFGQEFYYDLLADFQGSPKLSKYADLFNGSTYTINGHSYTHEGLIPVLVYFAHARYIMGKDTVDTAYGTVLKTNDYSQPSEEKRITRLADNSRSLAFAYLQPVIKFMDDNHLNYPLWRSYNYEAFYAGYDRYYPGTRHNHCWYRRNNGNKTRITPIG